MKQRISLLHEYAGLAVIDFHIPHVLARVERGERGGRIGDLSSLVFTVNPILGSPNQSRTAKANHQNSNPGPAERGPELGQSH